MRVLNFFCDRSVRVRLPLSLYLTLCDRFFSSVVTYLPLLLGSISVAFPTTIPTRTLLHSALSLSLSLALIPFLCLYLLSWLCLTPYTFPFPSSCPLYYPSCSYPLCADSPSQFRVTCFSVAIITLARESDGSPEYLIYVSYLHVQMSY